jgi:hypothetical protein
MTIEKTHNSNQFFSNRAFQLIGSRNLRPQPAPQGIRLSQASGSSLKTTPGHRLRKTTP